jgi:DNA repair exonuclease SbcCD ATPase subunit
MAQENTSDAVSESPSADSAGAGAAKPAVSASAPEGLLDKAALAEGLDRLEEDAADSTEVAKQLEELTGVVLSSAEVSTRSASVAANISQDMRTVMDQITESHKRSVQHSRIILGGLLAFLLIGLGTFFAIATRMHQNIRQLDSMSLAVGKRVVDLDATVNAFVETSRTFNDLNEKLEKQAELQGKLEQRFEEIQKTMAAVPNLVADQSGKTLDTKLQGLQKQIQALETKVQDLSKRPQPNSGPSQQAVISEIQKLKKDLDTANANAKSAAVAAAQAQAQAKAKPELKPEPKPEPKPEIKPAEVKPPPPPPVPSIPPAPSPRDKMLVYPRPNTNNGTQ